MKQVLLFPENRAPEDGHTKAVTPKSDAFMAIFHPSLDETHMQSLSSRFMRCSDQVWLIDLSPCLSYWNYQADRAGLSLYAWFRNLIQKLAPERSYYAALASDPWRALVLMRVMEEKGHYGLLGYGTSTGENLYRSLSWSCWWRCCEEYIRIAAQSQFYSNSQLKHLQQAIHRMELAIKRLGIACPVQFLEAPLAQLRRRFGEALTLLWTLTFPSVYQSTNMVRNSLKLPALQPSEAQDVFSYNFFPWIPYNIAEKPNRKRTLDYPLLEWNHVANLLREDFEALTFLDSFKKENRIISLEWRVVLQNQVEIFLIIPFRHPHDLQHEAPHFRTALLQVHYQFEKQMRKLQQEGRELDHPALGIVHWELQLAETIRVLPQNALIFKNDHEDLSQLIELENRLPVALDGFHSKLDWIPEDSYQLYQTDNYQSSSPFKHRQLPGLDDADWERHSLQIMASNRPLYIYTSARPMPSSPNSGLWRFQERAMDKWWQQHSPNSHRDYYRHLIDQQNLWVFRNASGKWYAHGVFA